MELGKINKLKANREQPQGIYLIDEEGEEVLLPNKYIPEGLELEDEVEVFIYTDSEDRNIATTLKPDLTRGSFGYLEVTAVSKYGAFLDWGLEKDLFVPFKEQKEKMEKDRSYIVFLYLDWSTNRLCASSRLDQFIEKENIELEKDQEVEVLIYSRTDLGYKAIINDKYFGLIYKDEVYKNIIIGQKMTAYVKQVREDDKIDLSLQKRGADAIEPNAQIILDYLTEHGGQTSITDKSSPDEIAQQFGMSKKAFKKAVGNLYKARKISIEDSGIRLN